MKIKLSQLKSLIKEEVTKAMDEAELSDRDIYVKPGLDLINAAEHTATSLGQDPVKFYRNIKNFLEDVLALKSRDVKNYITAKLNDKEPSGWPAQVAAPLFNDLVARHPGVLETIKSDEALKTAFIRKLG